MRVAKVCSTPGAAQRLQIPQKFQVQGKSIHAIDFASVELFSVTYLGLHLVRKCETQQTCKQTVKQLPQRQRVSHHTIMNSSSRGHYIKIRPLVQPCKQIEYQNLKRSTTVVPILFYRLHRRQINNFLFNCKSTSKYYKEKE